MKREFTGADFAQTLAEGTLKTTLVIRGMVKASDDPSIVQFCGDGRCGVWIPIPSNLIEKAIYLGETRCKDHSHQVAEIQLRDPSPGNPEAVLFAALFEQVFQAHSQLERRVAAKAMSADSSHLPSGESTWECLFEVCHGWGCTHYCLFGAP